MKPDSVIRADMKEIIDVCNSHFDVDVTNGTRAYRTASARHACFYLLRNKGFQRKEIAREFNMNSGSVGHGIKQTELRIADGLITLPNMTPKAMRRQRASMAIDAALRKIRPIMIREILKALE